MNDFLVITHYPLESRKRACRKRRPSDTVPCSITMPVDLQEAIIRLSEAEDRSFSATVRVAVERYIKTTAA